MNIKDSISYLLLQKVSSRRKKTFKAEKMIPNDISVAEVLDYLSEGHSDEDSFKWISKHSDIKHLPYSKRFGYQFDALKELKNFIENLPNNAKRKWLTTLKNANYELPYTYGGWPLLFGRFIPSLCLQFLYADLSFLHKKSVSNKDIEISRRNLEKEIGSESVIFEESSKAFDVAKTKRDFKIKYLRALIRVKSKERKIENLKMENQKLNYKIQAYKKYSENAKNKLNNLGYCKSATEEIGQKLKGLKVKRRRKSPSTERVSRAKSVPKVDKPKANSLCIIQSAETKRPRSAKKKRSVKMQMTKRKRIVNDCKTISATQISPNIYYKIPRDIDFFVKEPSTTLKTADKNNNTLSSPEINTSNKLASQATVANFEILAGTSSGSDLVVTYDAHERDANMSLACPLMTENKISNNMRSARKSLKQIKILCSTPQHNPKELFIAIRLCEENLRSSEPLANEMEYKIVQYEREIQVLQTDLNHTETLLKSLLNDKDSLKKKYSDLKKKCNSLKHTTSSSKSAFNGTSLKHIKVINVSKKDNRTNLKLLESNKQCSQLKEDLSALKLFVKEELSTFNIIFEQLKSEREKFHNKLLAKEEECSSLKKFINEAKLTLGISSSTEENDLIPFDNSLEIDQIKTYHSINMKNFSHCTLLLNSLKQQISEYSIQNTQNSKEKKLLRIRLHKLGKNVQNLRTQIKRSKAAYKKVSSYKCSHDSCKKEMLEHTVKELEVKNEKLECMLAELDIVSKTYNDENHFLKSRCQELQELLKQEQEEASRQLELQIAMYCSTANRYREQINRIGDLV